MIPILYTADERRFVTNGLGRLTDCTRCVVTEERNGIYECEFDYPITGAHFDEIEIGRLVACTHDDRHDIQPFVIYARTVPDLNGIVTFYAHHISYRLSDVVVMPFVASSVAEALQNISAYSVNANPFTFWTDKTTVANFENDVPRNARNMLGGEENSILDVYGSGEYEFDLFEVKLYAHRGADSDVEIRYSKNLTGLSEDIDHSGTYNAVVPFWTNAEGRFVSLPEKMIIFEGVEPQIAYLTDHNLVIIRTENYEPIEVAYTMVDAAPMDLSDAFEEEPTVTQLRNAAISRFNSSKGWEPSENLEVDFIQLAQTEEFADYAALQRVSLCDTVSVYYPQVGINKVKQKVVKVTYNVLLDRYDSIELGDIRTSLGQAIKSSIMEDVPTTSMMDEAIEYATDLIRGGLGGYVVMTPGPKGYPEEILIMDSPSTDTAVNVWRFNKGGLGHSSNGYQGPFSDIALTADGKINASMITTGIINANLITAGSLSADRISGGTLALGGLDNVRGNLTVYDENGYKVITTDQKGITLVGTTRWTASDGSFYSALRMNQGSLSFYRIANRDDSLDSTNKQGELDTYNKGVIRLQGGDGGSVILKTYRGDLIVSEKESRLALAGFTYYNSVGEATYFDDSVYVAGDLIVNGTKPRVIMTQNYGARLNYCYETPTPLFGDIGEAQLGTDGLCYVDIDDIFSETIAEKVEYQVFLQREGEGDCWISEKQQRYFVIRGTPNLKVAWELKAKQRDYELIRNEPVSTNLDEYDTVIDKESLIDNYINEQEELLYDN